MDQYYNKDENGFKLPKYADLPILKKKDEIITAAKNARVIIITGETGSGKSTQVPQYLLDDLVMNNKPGQIYVTQPRNGCLLKILSFKQSKFFVIFF